MGLQIGAYPRALTTAKNTTARQFTKFQRDSRKRGSASYPAASFTVLGLLSTNPDLYNVAEPFHTPNCLFLVCPLFLLFGRDKKLMWLAICSVVFFVAMSWFAWTARYLLPIYPPLTLIAAYVVVRATEWLKLRSAIARALPVITLLLTTGATVFVEASQLIKTRELNYINGSMSRADFMSQFFYYPSQRYVNENASRESRVFMVGCQMAYDLQRPYVADATWESTPWRRLLLKADTPEGVRDVMKAEGITHVIYSPGLNVFSTLTGRLSSAGSGAEDSARSDYYEQWRIGPLSKSLRRSILSPFIRISTRQCLYSGSKVSKDRLARVPRKFVFHFRLSRLHIHRGNADSHFRSSSHAAEESAQ